MIHQNAHSVSVAGVIIDDQGRALLTQRRDNGRWEAPGGILELHEDITAGLLREIHEETGLQVEPLGLTGVYKNMPQGIIALVFRCKVVGGHLTKTNETSAFRWTTADEMRALTTEAFGIRILDAMQIDGTPAIRHHDGTHLLEGSTGSSS